MCISIYNHLFDHKFSNRSLAYFYLKRYIKFIQWYKNNPSPKGYFEKHHIVPKSWDPSLEFKASNIITLSARQHFIAHLILSFTDDADMVYAAQMLIGAKKGNIKVNGRIYSIIQEKVRKAKFKPIVDLNTGIIYESVTAASLALGYKNRNQVSTCICSHSRCKGHFLMHWFEGIDLKKNYTFGWMNMRKNIKKVDYLPRLKLAKK